MSGRSHTTLSGIFFAPAPTITPRAFGAEIDLERVFLDPEQVVGWKRVLRKMGGTMPCLGLAQETNTDKDMGKIAQMIGRWVEWEGYDLQRADGTRLMEGTSSFQDSESLHCPLVMTPLAAEVADQAVRLLRLGSGWMTPMKAVGEAGGVANTEVVGVVDMAMMDGTGIMATSGVDEVEMEGGEVGEDVGGTNVQYYLASFYAVASFAVIVMEIPKTRIEPYHN